MNTWILTDDASGQHVQLLGEHPPEFKIIDTVLTHDGRYAVVRGSVTVADDDLSDPKFVDAYLRPFGYESAQDLIELCGSAAPQIAAECVFETNPFSYGDILFKGSLEACLNYIVGFVGGSL